MSQSESYCFLTETVDAADRGYEVGESVAHWTIFQFQLSAFAVSSVNKSERYYYLL